MNVIIALGYARQDILCDIAGQYLEWYDPNAGGGGAVAIFTRDITKAKKFSTRAEALAEWNLVRTIGPARPDGKPNKPLTALSVEIREV